MKPALSYDSLKQVLVEQQEEVAQLKTATLVEREKSAEILAVLDKPWIKVITGIRRCGKSILAHQALKDRRHGYVNFDDERLIGVTAQDLNRILQFLLELNPGVQILFFDEIQNVEGWELVVNRLQRQGYNLIITGSNSKLLSKELATHLTGRYVTIELTPFSFSEFLIAKQFVWSETSLYQTKERAQLYTLLNDYLTQGGFPEMAIGSYHAPYLRELYDKIIARDITYRYNVKYSNALKEIAIYSHANLGDRLTYHKVRNIFDIKSIHTVKNYYQYLSDAYLVFLLNQFSFKFKEQVKQPRKIYTVDNGLSSAISPKFTQDRGKALENLVYQELCRRGGQLSYFADQDAEVDFVVQRQKQITALVQVAYEIESPDTRKRETKALVKASQQLRCKNLYILTWEEESEETIEGFHIHILPIWKWLLFRNCS